MKPYLNRVSGKPTKSDVTLFSGGLNICYDKSFIQDNQLPFMMNVTLKKSPTLRTRDCRTSIAWFLNDTTSYAQYPVLKMFASSTKTLYTIEDRATEDNPTADNHVYKYIVNSEKLLTKVYVGSLARSSRYSICECRDAQNQYIIISTNTKRYQFKVDEVFNTATGITECEDSNAGIVACHKNRLWIAKGTSLKFSNLREYNNFTIKDDDKVNTAGEINITNAIGDITAIIPYDGKLMVFCEGSRHVIYGSTPNAELDQFSLVDFDDGIGCVSDETITICNRQLFWIDSDFSIYRYNGSYTNKISEPYGNDNYASYGGIKDLNYQSIKIKNFVMSSYSDYVYISMQRSLQSNAKNDTLLVYDTKNRVWWAEDGDISHIIRWDTDTNTPFYNRSDYLIGSKYNGDILILNASEFSGDDLVFNKVTRACEQIPIKYSFETKTWLLGGIKNKKTVTNVWFQANATAKVGICDYWGEHNAWDTETVKLDIDYLILGTMETIGVRHNILTPHSYMHEGGERQRFIVPKMYMQKINAFSIRVDGEGLGEFFMMEKEWRIK